MGYFSDDEDEDWDEWMKLTDEQAEAIVQAEEKKYSDWLDSLTALQQYRHHRRLSVENCRNWRRLTRENAWLAGEFGTGEMRTRQISLLKLRIWRSTGIYPGSA